MFRFTTRDMLWLTVVVALVFGWTMDHDRLARQSRALRSVMRDHGIIMRDDVIVN
jgi:hypothetical protein